MGLVFGPGLALFLDPPLVRGQGGPGMACSESGRFALGACLPEAAKALGQEGQNQNGLMESYGERAQPLKSVKSKTEKSVHPLF